MREPDDGQVEDVDSRNERPTRSSVLTLLGLLGSAVLVAMLLGQLTAPDPPAQSPTAAASTNATDRPTGPASDKPIGVESLKRCLVPVGGLALGDHLRLPGWPIDEGYNAKIVGDLGQTQLADLATRITVQQGRPHFSRVDGFPLTTATTYRPPAVHEISYQSVDLGQEGRIGSGEIWTAVMTAVQISPLPILPSC